MKLRIVYMGTPDFAVPALERLIETHNVVGVVTNPDRRAGRGKELKPPPVKVVAMQHDIPVYQPIKLRKNDEAFRVISDWEPDVAVVAAYGQILPQRFLDIPKHGCVNIHASLLPLLRGAAPINWAIVRGHKKSGVTTMLMEKGLDTGPMLLKKEIEIGALDTAQDLHDTLAELGAQMIVPTLDGLTDGTLTPTEQDHDASTYAPMMEKTDGRIDWTQSAEAVANLIRGMNPWPGAYAERDDKKIKFHLAKPVDGKGEPGEVIVADKSLVIACGEDAIDVLEIQPPNARRMSAKDFVNGTRIAPGAMFQ